MIQHLSSMIGDKDTVTQHGKSWVRAVPMPFQSGIFGRIADAWAVINGRAYAIRWPQPGELEHAVDR